MKRVSRTGTLLRRSGTFLLVVGVFLFWGGCLFNPVMRNTWKYPWWFVYIFFAVGGLLFSWGGFLSWRERQYAAKAANEKIFTGSKPDVLYLRAFQSDISNAEGAIGSGQATPEEQLADVLRPIGDLVAIGQPGEELPLLGAARIYLSNEEWKGDVRCAQLGSS